MVADDTRKFADTVTVYKDSNAALIQEMENASKATGATVHNTKIRRLTNGGAKSEMTIEFENKEFKTEGFLVHQPVTKVNHKAVSQSGLELDGKGDIVVKPPFYQTNVLGVFVAGDCASPFKIISNALPMGANAGPGIARELPRRVTGAVSDWAERKIQVEAALQGK